MTDLSYIELVSMSDKALAAHIGAFIKHHRMEQNRTQNELATAAGISRSTLSLLERGETVTVATLIQVLRILDQLSVLQVFNIKQTPSPLAMAKALRNKRQRAKNTSTKRNNPEETDW
jgi:transcriptional regulator with XRE-family HTH domain